LQNTSILSYKCIMKNYSFAYSGPEDSFDRGYAYASTALTRADFGLIYGNKHMCRELAETAAAHYHAGLFDKIIVSGGVIMDNVESDILEADALAQGLMKNGVPKLNIIFERAARNTQENIVNSKDLLHKAGLFADTHSVIGFGHAKAGDRFLMTLAKSWSKVLPMHVQVAPRQVFNGEAQACKEFERERQFYARKIPAYTEMGYLHPVDHDKLTEEISDYATRFGQGFSAAFPSSP